MPEQKVTLESAIAKYNAGELSFENFQKIVAENGNTLAFYAINKERNPQYPEGDNRSRVGFTYNPSEHPRGIFFQQIIKKVILMAIDMGYAMFFNKNRIIRWLANRTVIFIISTVHSALMHKYDKNIFIYNDVRLNVLNNFLKRHVKENFQHAYPYKHNFMLQILDIILGLAKEDIYYRARLFNLINKFQEICPNRIILTETEKQNVDKN